jgi:hypothetical protein
VDAEALFLATLDDLAARSEPGRSTYDVIQIAALLRKLLLDGSRLVDTVNGIQRLPLRFRANVRQPPDVPGLVFWSIQDGLDPDTALSLRGNTADLTRDQFLGLTIILVGGERLTVADIVRYLAHIAGAVHIGTPTTAKEKALAAMSTSIQVGGYSPEVRSMLAVARVVTKTLQPLRRAIEEGRTSPK